ncbi:bone morphogenetic protein 1-like isoform X2 [Oculina patagonica]
MGYSHPLQCNWLITVPEGNIVKLSFDNFFLVSSCYEDYVQVVDGNYTNSKIIRTFCGFHFDDTPKHPVRSSGQYMLVRFRSDWFFGDYSRGFKATFTAENEAICPYTRLVVSAASYEKTLTSPNYPSNTDSGLNCNWLLEVDNGLSSGGYIVKVTFSDFAVECDDELRFYDGNSTSSRLLGSYCGSATPEVIYSTGRYLYVNFRTDDYYTYKGFSLSFSAVKEGEASGICRQSDGENKVRRLSGSSGTFFSPDYPYHYPDDVRCVWTISVPAGKVIKLRFENFYLDSEDCKRSTKDKDHVQIRDGQVLESKELALYCGYYEFMGPSDVYSTGSHMTVIFQSISDGKQSSKGFNASFEAVDPQSATSDHLCFSGNVNNNNLKITASHGTLQSPLRTLHSSLRDSVYPPDLSCDWLITVPEGKTVKLSFERFDLEPSSWSGRCTADYVEILDGKYNYSERKGKFCDHRPEDITSSGRYMWVRFRSDSAYYAYSGFNASFIAEDKPTVGVPASSKEVCFPGNINNYDLKLTGSHGTLQSPQEDSTYPPDSSCDWLITVPEGKIVKLSFDRFDLEWSEGCTEDYVEVRDGNGLNSESKGRFCGLTAPDDIRASGRYMGVAFRSDSEYSYYGGFKATFTAEDKPSSSSTTIIIVIVSVVLFFALVCCVVCGAMRKKKPNNDADVAIPMTTSTTSASRTTRPGVAEHSPHPSRQAPSVPALNLNPLPPVGYAPVPTNPKVPPPAYPYPLESPPPYPGDESAPQYPPPGQSYPWQQTNSSAPAEPSAPTEGPTEPSAPPENP